MPAGVAGRLDELAEVRERQGDGRGAQDAYRRAELAEELAR